MTGFGIVNIAPVRQTTYRRLSVKAAAHVFSPRQGRSRTGTLLSTSLTTGIVLVGFGAITPFIVAAILNAPALSIADDGGREITASITAAPLPGGETIVQNVAIAPAKLLSEMQSDAIQSAEPRPAAMLGTHRESNSDRLSRVLAPIARTEETAERDNLTVVFRTELQNAERATDPEADLQPLPEPTERAAAELQPEQTELAAEQLQPELTKPFTKPKPRPTKFAAKEPSAPTRLARVRRDVRMRAGPRNSAAVVTVVRAGSELNVVNCTYWCEVTFNGKRGWIYKSFVR